MPERLSAMAALLDITDEIPDLVVIWVDQGFSGANFVNAVAGVCDAKVEVIKRIEAGFQVLPKRWIVKRTFGWFSGCRRLSKDEVHLG